MLLLAASCCALVVARGIIFSIRSHAVLLLGAPLGFLQVLSRLYSYLELPLELFGAPDPAQSFYDIISKVLVIQLS